MHELSILQADLCLRKTAQEGWPLDPPRNQEVGTIYAIKTSPSVPLGIGRNMGGSIIALFIPAPTCRL